MMKRILTIWVILLAANLPMGCVDEGCGDFTLLESRITELTPLIGTFDSLSGFSTLVSQTYDSAAINIFISEMEYSKISQIQPRTFSLMNTAYACSPPEPGPTQAISSIRVTSTSTLYFDGQEYASGEDLVDLFKVSGGSYSIDETTIDQYIESQNKDLWIFGYVGADITFQLTGEPDSAINQEFIFIFEFSDSEIIEVRAPVFQVNVSN